MSEKRVLIVEDVEEMGEQLKQLVSDLEGFRVTGLAKNLWDARLELVRRRPDIVLLDEVLPGESSLDFLAELHASGIAVWMVTSTEDPTHALPPQAKGRLSKPGWKTWEEDKQRFLDELGRDC